MTAGKMSKKQQKLRKPRGPAFPIILRMARETRGYRGLLLLALVLMFLSTAFSLVNPWLIRLGIDDMILTGDVDLLWLLALFMIFMAFLEGIFSFSQRYLMEWVGQRIVYRLRGKVYEHLHGLSFCYYDQARTGDIMSRVTADIDVLKRFLGFGLVQFLANMGTIVGIVFILLFWDLGLVLLYLLLIPLMIHALATYALKVSPMFRFLRRHLAELTSQAQETLAGIRVVKLFGQEDKEKEGFLRANEQYYAANLEAARIRALWMPYVNFLIGLGTALILWYGGWRVIEGTLTLGIVVGFFNYLGLLMRPIRQSGMMVSLLTAAAAAAERIFEVLDTQSQVQDRPGAYPLPPVEGHLEVCNVTFGYDQDEPVLNDVNLTVEGGEMVALVGPTGAGKSTLLHLIPRFYELEQGSITIDGHSIQEVTVESLRARVGMMLQDTFIFQGTVRENLMYGVPQAPWEAVEEVAKQVQLHEEIMALPQGYETPLGERGVGLSGGQRQRLAMARVLLKDPEILLLDEPTSSLDAGTEARLQEALHHVMTGRTVVVVAHRLWTLQRAGRIVVLDQGRIVQEGSHDELLGEEGPYKDIYKKFLSSDPQMEGREGP